MNANTASATETLALLDKLKTELPEIWSQDQVVGKWVWLEFNSPSAFRMDNGASIPRYLTTDQRVRHTHIIGSSGTGKSSLLFNLISQDIQNGEGVAVLDPHGDLIHRKSPGSAGGLPKFENLCGI